MGWKKIGTDMYERRTRAGSTIAYVQKYKGGYTLNYGQAPISFVIRKTKKEALKDLADHKKLFK